jgi:hypothetical protein
METRCFFEMLVSTYKSMRCYNPEDQHKHIHTHTLIYIPCIQKVLRMTVGCGISHKNTRHTVLLSKLQTNICTSTVQNIIKISPKIKVSV